MSLPLDQRVFCSECGGAGGALRIVKGLSMLGHTSSPAKLHPFQLARSAAVATHPGGREDNQRQTEGLGPLTHSLTTRSRTRAVSKGSIRTSRGRSGSPASGSSSPQSSGRSRPLDGARSVAGDEAAAATARLSVGRSPGDG